METISAHTVIIGKIKCSRPVKILGQVIGEVNSAFPLEIGTTGDISGTVSAPSVKVLGAVRGRVTAESRIEVGESSYIEGPLLAPALVRP